VDTLRFGGQALAALAFLLAAAPLQAQVAPDPAEAGLSGPKLREGVRLYEEAVARDDIRGAVLLVARRGRIALHEAVGMRDKEAGLPLDRDAVFRMASNTKPVVAAAVLMLEEEGRLRLDDPVGRHLPAFDNEKCRAMTVAHLLTHTSGLRIKTLFLEPLLKETGLRVEVDRFAAVGPEEKPGATFSYNNPGFNVLGALIEACSGRTLEAFLTERIYRPLEMADSSNHPVPERIPRMSVIYRREKEAWTVAFRPESPEKVPFVRASGGMFSTARDYARFCQMFLDGGVAGGKRLLSEASVRAATAPQTRSIYTADELRTRASFYGYGWSVSADGIFSHGGSEGTFAWVDPGRKIVGLVLTQSPGGKNPVDAFRKLVNDACEP
jgi:CubicO group peptidase (beta-lactamase class C family)